MKVVSFFSGLGGLDKGFADTGYDIIWANDFDKYACKTYRYFGYCGSKQYVR